MRYLLSFLILLFPLSTSAYWLVTKTVDGYKVRILHIPAGDGYRMTAVASHTGTTLKSLVENAKWVAGINGAYFAPRDYSGKADTTNAIRIIGGDGMAYSQYYPDTGINGIFGFLADGAPILVQNNIYGERSLRQNYNSGRILELESGIANFPILLASGANIVPKYDKAGLITAKMKVKSTKSFICRTAKNEIKMGTIDKISMMVVPFLLKQFGCIDAINLDSGGSLAMYDKMKYVYGPGRNIMDAFVIVKK